MPPIQETGHTKNVSAFYAMLGYVQGWGTDYKPTNPLLALAKITAQHPLCETAEKEARDQEKVFNDLVDDRQIAFKTLKPYSTRIYNSFSSIGLPKETVNGALEINRKIQGRRATPKKDNTTPATEGETPKGGGKSISASQQSFDNNVKHLDDLRAWVELQAIYNPNETDLKIAAIKAYHTKIDTANKAVIAAQVPYDNKLNARDAALYGETTGMVDIALEIKKYALGAFGSKSPKYKQISGLKFRKLPRKK
jgi:hypothetical protein